MLFFKEDLYMFMPFNWWPFFIITYSMSTNISFQQLRTFVKRISLSPPWLSTLPWSSVNLLGSADLPASTFLHALWNSHLECWDQSGAASMLGKCCSSELYPKSRPDFLVLSKASVHWRVSGRLSQLLGSLLSHPMWLVHPLPSPSHWLSQAWLHSQWRFQRWQLLKSYLVCSSLRAGTDPNNVLL